MPWRLAAAAGRISPTMSRSAGRGRARGQPCRRRADRRGHRFDARLGPHPLARGLNGGPRLGGYVVTAPRPGTDVVMRSHLDDPVLAVGRRGLGRVAVYTGDLHSPWSAGLAAMACFGALVARTMRWVSRAVGSPGPARVDAQPPLSAYRDRRRGRALMHACSRARSSSRARCARRQATRSELVFKAACPGPLRRRVSAGTGGPVRRQRDGDQRRWSAAGHAGPRRVLRRSAGAGPRGSGSGAAGAPGRHHRRCACWRRTPSPSTHAAPVTATAGRGSPRRRCCSSSRIW